MSLQAGCEVNNCTSASGETGTQRVQKACTLYGEVIIGDAELPALIGLSSCDSDPNRLGSSYSRRPHWDAAALLGFLPVVRSAMGCSFYHTTCATLSLRLRGIRMAPTGFESQALHTMHLKTGAACKYT